MLRLAVVVAVVIAFSALAFSRENAPAEAQSAPSPAKVRPACDRAPLRSGVVDRRLATWRWQDELGEDRFPASFAERRARGCAYLHWIRGLWSGRADSRWRRYASLSEPERAIRYVFRGYAGEALRVAWCESHLTTTAENGQYLGLFQMGSSERATFGHGSTALEQVRAAYRYFVASGRDWSPWSCKP